MREATVVERDYNKQSATLSQKPFLKCEIGKQSVFAIHWERGYVQRTSCGPVAQPVKAI